MGWLLMAAPLILLEAQPRRSSDGTPVTVRLAGSGGELPYFYGDQHYRAGIVQLPTFITSIDFGGETSEAGEFGAGGVPQALELEWAPSDMAAFSEVAGHYWPDAPVSIFIGPETGGKPPVALTGKALAGNVDGGVLTIAMSDPVADLKKPLLTERYGGTGDLDGPSDWAGTIKQRVWGRVWNVAGDPIDPANDIYCFADPLRPIEAISAVRDRGANASALTLLSWQGSAAATLDALRAAVAPRGGGVVCPSISCCKWWTQPGDLTADLRGEIGAGYVETTAQIVERIIQAGTNLPFAPGTVAAAAAARPAAVGWIANDDITTQAAMIEELLGNSSLLWLLDATGQIVLREWAWKASVTAGRSLDVRRIRTLKPVGTRQLGYRRNEHVMPRSSLAGIVLAEDTLFEDGTSLEHLKPAEPGATSGAPSGTNIGDRPVDDVLADLDLARTNIEAAQEAIDQLFDTYGDTLNAAQSAAEAAASAVAAEAAKGASESAGAAAQVAATQAQNSATTADGSATAAANSATTAAAASTAAGGSATAASSSANSAATRATEAGASAAAAASSATAAYGYAGDAVSAASTANIQASVATGAAAAAQSSAQLAASVGLDITALSATVNQQAGVIADRLTGTAAAYIRQEAIAGNGRAQLSIWANGNGGGGVDIVGDVGIHGNLLVLGSVTGSRLVDLGVDTSKIAANAAAKIAYVAVGTVFLVNNVEVTCASLVVTKDRADSVLKISVHANAQLQDNALRVNRIRVNGNIEWTSDHWPAGDDTTRNTEAYAVILAGLPAGNHTITFAALATNATIANFSYMTRTFLDVEERKR